MKNMKRLFAVVLALVLCFALAGNAFALGDTCRWGVYSAPDGLWMYGLYSTMYDQYVMQLIDDPLFYFDEHSETESYIPRLATGVEISEDSLTYTFSLRNDVTWHDGEAFTADDVVFDFTSNCDARMNSRDYVSCWSKVAGAAEYYEYTTALANGETPATTVEGVSGIVKVDDYTVSVTLTEIYAPFMSTGICGHLITPKHYWEGIDPSEWKTSAQLANPIGCGPYKFVAYEQDQYVTFVANENYYLGAPKIQNFVYKIVNQDTAQVELLNGDLDIVSMISNPTEETMNTYAENNCQVIEAADFGYQYMPINNNCEKLSNPTVRQAIAYALNRQGIVDALLNGHGLVCNAPIYMGSWAYPSDLTQYEYNPQKAVELFAEAGISDTDGDGLLEDAEGNDFTLSLICPMGNKVREQSAVVFQQNLAAIGVTVNVETMEFNTLMERCVYSDNYELALIGLSVSADPSSIYTCFCSANATTFGNNNMSGYANAELDALMDAGTQTTDAAERTAAYYDALHILNNDLPEIWLYSANEIRAARPELQNYAFQNTWEFVDVHTWEFAE